MTDEPTFRIATVADIEAMSRIRLAVTENSLSDPARITRQMYEDYLEELGRGWVAEHDGTVIGFAYASRADGSVWALFVDPAHEGRGAARGLLKRVVTWLFALGHARIHLTTEAGTRADRFYVAQGWTRGAVLDNGEIAFTLDISR